MPTHAATDKQLSGAPCECAAQVCANSIPIASVMLEVHCIVADNILSSYSQLVVSYFPIINARFLAFNALMPGNMHICCAGLGQQSICCISHAEGAVQLLQSFPGYTSAPRGHSGHRCSRQEQNDPRQAFFCSSKHPQVHVKSRISPGQLLSVQASTHKYTPI